MRILRVIVAAALLATAAAVPAVGAQQPDDADFGPMPYYGDCRDARGQVCVQDPWTGNLSVGPAVLAAFCAGLGSLAGGRSLRRHPVLDQ